ncbi:MAG TPA: hypothetical protein VEG25_00435 [Burkholderiales bacterium]|nr:hypothetical protein [Burkholderiales bacterium]
MVLFQDLTLTFPDQLPERLQVDEIVALGQHEKQISVVKGERN